MPYMLRIMFARTSSLLTVWGLILASLSCGRDAAGPDLSIQVRSITAEDSVQLLRGDTTTVHAVAKDGTGQILAAPLTWMSEDTLIASVDSGGSIYGISVGEVVVNVTSGRVIKSVKVKVTQPSKRWLQIDSGCGIWVDQAIYCWRWEAFGGAIMQPGRTGSPISFSVVKVGGYHKCAIANTGDVYCWGDNTFGQLGDGTTERRAVPTRVALDVPAVELALGPNHTCAVDSSGRAWCWGMDRFGQLGFSPSKSCRLPCALRPQTVNTTARFVKIAAGGYDRAGDGAEGYGHTCAVAVGGEAYCWGWNFYAQLGDGSRDDRFTLLAPGENCTLVAAENCSLELRAATPA